MLTAVYALTLVLTTVVFGAWSDRLGRRKVFVIWSGLVSGSAAVLLGVGQSWPAALAAAVVMGCAYGIYTAVDFALITEVLPTAIDRAKDLGVINIANALPQVFAPVLAGVLLWLVERAGAWSSRTGTASRPATSRSTCSRSWPASSARCSSPGSAACAEAAEECSDRRIGFRMVVTLQGDVRAQPGRVGPQPGRGLRGVRRHRGQHPARPPRVADRGDHLDRRARAASSARTR